MSRPAGVCRLAHFNRTHLTSVFSQSLSRFSPTEWPTSRDSSVVFQPTHLAATYIKNREGREAAAKRKKLGNAAANPKQQLDGEGGRQQQQQQQQQLQQQHQVVDGLAKEENNAAMASSAPVSDMVSPYSCNLPKVPFSISHFGRHHFRIAGSRSPCVRSRLWRTCPT